MQQTIKLCLKWGTRQKFWCGNTRRRGGSSDIGETFFVGIFWLHCAVGNETAMTVMSKSLTHNNNIVLHVAFFSGHNTSELTAIVPLYIACSAPSHYINTLIVPNMKLHTTIKISLCCMKCLSRINCLKSLFQWS